jgi:hypothetical protein
MKSLLTVIRHSYAVQGTLFALTFLGFAVASNAEFLFSPNTIPWFDFMANELLMDKAREFSLLHGNYSRLGFYHPGPFYFYVMLLSEWLLHDLIPLFPTTIAANFFSGSLLICAAIGGCWWLGATLSGRSIGGLITALFVISIGLYQTPYYFTFDTNQNLGNFLFSIWMPHLYMPSALFLAISCIAILTGRRGWWVVAIFAALQLIHGHASFYAIAPMILFATLIADLYFGSGALQSGSVFQRFLHYWRTYKRYVFYSLPIITIMLLPMGLYLWHYWPGEFPYYLNAGTDRTDATTPVENLEMLLNLVPPLSILLLLYVVHERQPRVAILSVAIAFSIPAILYILFGVDNRHYAYLIYWYIITLILLAGLTVSLWTKTHAAFRWGAVAFACLLPFISPFPYTPQEVPFYSRDEYRTLIDDMRALSPDKPVILSFRKKDFGSGLEDVLQMINMMQKSKETPAFCIHPQSWGIILTPHYRCKETPNDAHYILVSQDVLPYPILGRSSHEIYYDITQHPQELLDNILPLGEGNNFVLPYIVRER